MREILSEDGRFLYLAAFVGVACVLRAVLRNICSRMAGFFDISGISVDFRADFGGIILIFGGIYINLCENNAIFG